MNESQRAVIAAKLANMKRTDTLKQYRSANLPLENPSQAKAAELLNVSPRIIRAVKAIERAAPELVKEIERGEKTVHEAEKDLHCRVLTIPGLLTSRK